MSFNPERAFEYAHSFSERDLTDDEWEVNLSFAQPYRKKEPHIDDFKKIHQSDIDRQRDKQKVIGLKTRASEMEKTERAILLEAILAEHIEQSEWLGSNAYTFQTTEFDDRINHTDLVVEFEVPEGERYLAIDVTTTGDDRVLSDKKKRISQEIGRGSMTMIKYFESQVDMDNPQKVLNHIPRVVVNIRPEIIERLATTQRKILDKKPGANQAMAHDAVQIEILTQIESQLTDDVIQVLRNFSDIKHVPSDRKKDVERLLEIISHLSGSTERVVKQAEEKGFLDILEQIAQTEDDEQDAGNQPKISQYVMLKKLTQVRSIIQSTLSEKKENKPQRL